MTVSLNVALFVFPFCVAFLLSSLKEFIYPQLLFMTLSFLAGLLSIVLLIVNQSKNGVLQLSNKELETQEATAVDDPRVDLFDEDVIGQSVGQGAIFAVPKTIRHHIHSPDRNGLSPGGCECDQGTFGRCRSRFCYHLSKSPTVS